MIKKSIISCHFPLPLLFYMQVESFGSGELKWMRLVLKVSPFQYDQPISSCVSTVSISLEQENLYLICPVLCYYTKTPEQMVVFSSKKSYIR